MYRQNKSRTVGLSVLLTVAVLAWGDKGISEPGPLDFADINGDGYADMIVGAPEAGVLDSDEGLLEAAGKVHVYFGAESGFSHTPDQTLEGGEPGETFGLTVANAGDFDLDGYEDVVIGSACDCVKSQRTELFVGTPSGLSAEPLGSVEAGSTVVIICEGDSDLPECDDDGGGSDVFIKCGAVPPIDFGSPNSGPRNPPTNGNAIVLIASFISVLIACRRYRPSVRGWIFSNQKGTNLDRIV
jgi:FG-GAP repeat protein